MVALEHYVKQSFSVKGLPSREIGLFEGGGKTMKHVKIRSLEERMKKKGRY